MLNIIGKTGEMIGERVKCKEGVVIRKDRRICGDEDMVSNWNEWRKNMRVVDPTCLGY